MALADPVRRAIVARLARGDATVNELAEPFAITKQAVSRHIQVLEHAGLVTRSKDAQRRPVHLDAAALERLTAWIDRYRLIAEERFRRGRCVELTDDIDPALFAQWTGPRSMTVENVELHATP